MRVLRIIVPILLTIALFGGIFVVVMRLPETTPDIILTGTGADVTDDTGEPDDIVVTDTTYTYAQAADEATAYARDTVLHLATYSGLGIPLKPTAEDIQGWLDASGQATVKVKQAAYSIVPYARGSALLPTNELDLTDALTYRWDTSERTTKVRPATVAAAMRAEIAAAHFNIAAKKDLFDAAVYARLASEGMKFLEEKMKLTNGLYAASWQGEKITNGSVEIADQFAVLQAYAELIDFAETNAAYYVSPVDASQLRPVMDGYFSSIEQYIAQDETALTTLPERDLGHALIALSWYVTVTVDEDLREEASDMLSSAVDALKLAEATTAGIRPIATHAAKAAGYLYAARVLEDETITRSGLTALSDLEDAYDDTVGMYVTEIDVDSVLLTPGDVADLLDAYRAYSAMPVALTGTTEVLSTMPGTSGLRIPAPVADEEEPAEAPADYVDPIKETDKDTESDTDSDTNTDTGTESGVDANTDAESPVRIDVSDRFRTIVMHLIKDSGLIASESATADKIAPGDTVASVAAVYKAPVFIALTAYIPKANHWVTLDADTDAAQAYILAAALLRYTGDWTSTYTDANGMLAQ